MARRVEPLELRRVGPTVDSPQSWQQEVVGEGPDDRASRSAEPAAVVDADSVELPLATWSSTGDPAVDDALTRLLDLTDLAPGEQVAVFDALHRDLRNRLDVGSQQPESVGVAE